MCCGREISSRTRRASHYTRDARQQRVTTIVYYIYIFGSQKALASRRTHKAKKNVQQKYVCKVHHLSRIALDKSHISIETLLCNMGYDHIYYT